MIKKIGIILVLSAITMSLMCGCAVSKNDDLSSGAASKVTFSEVETSSFTESEQQSSNQDTPSEEKDEASSKNQEASASSENTSSEKTQSQNSSLKNPSTNYSTISYPSTTEDSGIKNNINPGNAMGIGAYHFNTGWTTNYGKTEDERYAEFEDVIKEGYFNTVIAGREEIIQERFWKICIENDVSVWLHNYSYFNSSKQTIDEYVANVDKYVSVVRKNKEWWRRFNGFHYEENILRGQTNADFLAETRAMYQKYGKRNMPVLATGEFTKYEGNEMNIEMTGSQIKKMNPKAFEFVTDVGFDSYSVDVRDGAPNGGKYYEWQNVSKDIVDGKSYYIEHTKVLLSLIDHPVNVWFFPCGFTDYLWGGLNGLKFADEEYCLAHLNFFRELLYKQRFKGGLILYTYTQFRENGAKGLQSHLTIEAPLSSPDPYKLRPNEAKWKNYSMRIKEITEEFKTTQENVILFLDQH